MEINEEGNASIDFAAHDKVQCVWRGNFRNLQVVTQTSVPTGTQWTAAVNLIASCMGCGLLTLPCAFANCGWFLGTVLLAIAAALSDVTLNYIADAARASRSAIYEDNVGHLMGDRWRQVTNWIQMLNLFPACVALICVFRDSLPPLIVLFTGAADTIWSDPYIVCAIAMICVYPLCLLPSTTSLSYTSTLSIFCLLYFVGCLIVKYVHHDGPWMHPSVVAIKAQPGGLLQSFCLFVLSFAGHSNFSKVYMDMHTSSRPHIRRVVHLSIFGAVFALYICTGLLGYFVFGSAVDGDVLLEFPPSLAVQISRAGLAITSLCRVPLMMMPLQLAVDKRLASCKVVIPSALLTLLLCLGSCAIAGLGCRLDGVLTLLGCTSFPMVQFIMPSLMRMRLDVHKQPASLLEGVEAAAEPPLPPFCAWQASLLVPFTLTYCLCTWGALVYSWLLH